VTVRRHGLFVAAVWFLTAVGQASVGPEAEVKVVGGRVHIQATATPVSTVLDRLSRTTGMKIVYEGAPPTDRLTATIDAGSETEALSRLLEGLGLTYAFKLDAAGRHVVTLFVTAAPPSSSSRRASSTAPSTPPPVMMTPLVDQEVDEDATAEITPVPEPEHDPAAQPGGVTGMTSVGPGYAGGPAMGGTTGDQAPGFPGAASFPQFPGAGFPTPPVVPGPASYPSPNVRL